MLGFWLKKVGYTPEVVLAGRFVSWAGDDGARRRPGCE